MRALLPGVLLPFSIHGEAVVPHFLRENDHPWLRALLEEYERFVGRPQRELDERLREELPCGSPAGKQRLAAHVLARLWGNEQQAVVAPRHARAAVFGEAANTPADPALVLAAVAAGFGATAGELRDSLFADLPGERLVAPPPHALSPGELALRANLALAQALLFRATSVQIEAEGNARALPRSCRSSPGAAASGCGPTAPSGSGG